MGGPGLGADDPNRQESVTARFAPLRPLPPREVTVTHHSTHDRRADDQALSLSSAVTCVCV